MNMRRLRSALIGLGAGLVLCTPNALAQDNDSRLEVVYASAITEGAVRVSSPMFKPAGNFMLMSVETRNNSAAPLQLEYKVDWFDETGFPIVGVSGWQTLFLSPNEAKDLRVAGQQAGAYSARLTIR